MGLESHFGGYSVKARNIGGVAAILLVGGCLFLAHWRFGSIANAIGYLNGREVQVDKSAIDLGTVALDKEIPVEFNLTNLHGRPFKIVGANASCSCISPPRMPITLSPLEPTSITFGFTSPEKPEQFAQEIELYFDGPVQTMQLKITGVAQ
jgi:hypothetical protein